MKNSTQSSRRRTAFKFKSAIASVAQNAETTTNTTTTTVSMIPTCACTTGLK